MRRRVGPMGVALVISVLIALVGPNAFAAPTEVWAACGTSAPADKVVRVFAQQPPPGALPRPATLLCGNDRFGYRHVKLRHAADWEALGFSVGDNWRGIADFAISQTLAVPQPGYPRYNAKNDTWTYKAPLQIKDSEGQTRVTYWPIISAAARDGRIITAFPSRDPL